MLDIGVTKLAIIGAIALVVIGPERLPGVARTLGTLLGRARSYVADVKAEVNRSMDLDELRKMRDTVQTAAQEVENTIQSHGEELSAVWNEANYTPAEVMEPPVPEYRHPGKNWRLKVGATPHWYKARQGVRTKALSGAARVARFRPAKVNG
jgi:sec-independent protein translocase protein TatB